MPVGRIARVGGMIQNRDTKLLTFERPFVVHPRRALAPNVLLGFEPFSVHHLAGTRNTLGLRRRLFERRSQPDGKAAFLGVTELHVFDGGERDVDVDHAAVAVGVERHLAGFVQQRVALRVQPFEAGLKRALLLAALDRAGLIENNLALLRSLLARFVGPEIETVHVAVREPQAAVMRVVLTLAFHIGHRIRASDDLAGRRAQRVQIRLGCVRSVEEGRERRTVDSDVHPVGLLLDLHLPKTRQHSHERDRQIPFHVKK